MEANNQQAEIRPSKYIKANVILSQAVNFGFYIGISFDTVPPCSVIVGRMRE